MTNNQENKLSMYNTTTTVCDENSGVLGTVPAFVTALSAVKVKVAAIRLEATRQDKNITGAATDKGDTKNTLAESAFTIAAAVLAYADSIGNDELLQSVNFSLTELKRTPDELVQSRFQNIHDAADDNIGALAPFGITAAVLAAFQTGITNFPAVTQHPRAEKVKKVTATSNLPALFRETDRIFKNQMDKLVVQYKPTVPDFVASYRTARIIIDLGATSSTFRFTIHDSSTLGGILGARIDVEGNGSGFSNQIGKGSINRIPVGNRRATVTAPGYNVFISDPLTFNPGKTISRTFNLQKI